MEDAVSPWFEAAKAHQVQRLARLSKGQGPSNDLRGGHRSRLDSDTPGSVPRALGVRPRRLLERERPLNQVAGEDVGRRRVEEGDHAAQAQGEELVNGRAHAVVGSAHALAAAHAAEEVVLLVVLAEALAARDDLEKEGVQVSRRCKAEEQSLRSKGRLRAGIAVSAAWNCLY